MFASIIERCVQFTVQIILTKEIEGQKGGGTREWDVKEKKYQLWNWFSLTEISHLSSSAARNTHTTNQNTYLKRSIQFPILIFMLFVIIGLTKIYKSNEMKAERNIIYIFDSIVYSLLFL